MSTDSSNNVFLAALEAKLRNLDGLDDKERKLLIAAIAKPATDFVSVSLKYSKFGSTTIQDIAKSAVTVNFLNEQAIAKWESRLGEVDFNIFSDKECNHAVNDEYLRKTKYPRTLFIKTKQIGFSEFGAEDALSYAGIGKIDLVDETDSRFPQPAKIEDSNEYLLHSVKDLRLKHKLYDPLEEGCEETRREFISAVLVLAASFAGVKLACEEEVNGSIGKGPVDWTAHYENHRIFITEGKKDNITQGLYQNLAQLTAAGEGRGQKRSFCVDLPLYGIATTYREWIILRLDPAAAESRAGIRLPTLSINERKHLREDVQEVAAQIAGLLLNQKERIPENTGTESKKAKR